MKYKILVDKVVEKTQYDPEKVSEIVQLALYGIIDIITTEGQIELSNFGEFKIVTSKARKKYNLQTCETYAMPNKQKVRFKPSKIMKERLNRGE